MPLRWACARGFRAHASRRAMLRTRLGMSAPEPDLRASLPPKGPDPSWHPLFRMGAASRPPHPAWRPEMGPDPPPSRGGGFFSNGSFLGGAAPQPGAHIHMGFTG